MAHISEAKRHPFVLCCDGGFLHIPWVDVDLVIPFPQVILREDCAAGTPTAICLLAVTVLFQLIEFRLRCFRNLEAMGDPPA
jgi:hypothetical protein